MNRITRVLAALAVGAFAALAPAAAAQATSDLTGKAVCVDGGWQAQFTFTNHHPTYTAVIEKVTGAVSPAVPVRVAPGASVTEKTGTLSTRGAYLAVGYRWDKPLVKAEPPVVSTPPTISPAPTDPADTDKSAVARTQTHPKTDLVWVKAHVSRCKCPKPTVTPSSPSTKPPTSPSTPPTTAVPTTPPPSSPSVPPEVEPSEDTPPTATAPPQQGPGSGGGSGSLPLTGAPVAFSVAGGAALLLAGVGTVWLVRRRRTSFSA